MPTRRLPYVVPIAPVDGALNVLTSASIQFVIVTDDLGAASIPTGTVNVLVNNVPVITAGVNVLPGTYSSALTPGLRQLSITLAPTGVLSTDTVYTVDVTAEDDLGTAGTGRLTFSTGAVGFACLMDRQEPLLCPLPDVLIPLFSETNVSTTRTGDTVSSVSADFSGRGLTAYDYVEITSGPDKGRWIARAPSINTARLYHTNQGTSTGLVANQYRRQVFADRNPVHMVASKLLPYPHQKVWGSTATRYFAGYPSDTNFPVGFEDVPEHTFHDYISNPANSNGGVFDDQTSNRLSFDLLCMDPTTASMYDRYTIPLAAAVRSTLTDTATLTNGAAVVSMSGITYRTQLHVGATVTFGSDTTEYTVQAIDLVLQEITLSTPWASANIAAQAVHRKIAGTRTISSFELSRFDTGAHIFFGLSGNVGSPTSDAADRAGVAFKANANNTVTMTAHLGVTSTSVVTDLTPASFVGKDWSVEIEFIDENAVQVSLLDPLDLTTVSAQRTVTVNGTAGAINLTGWTLTTFDITDSILNSRAIGWFDHIDVEPGQGTVYVVPGLTIPGGDAKARKARNIYGVGGVGHGWLSFNTTLALDPAAFLSTQSATIFLDTEQSFAIIESFTIEGGATIDVDENEPTQRTVKKFSFNQGFDQISLTFKANNRGYWYCIIDGTNPRTDTVIATGLYDVVGSSQTIEFFGDELDVFGDGVHTINVVLCKEPVPTSPVFLQGVARLWGSAETYKPAGAIMIGTASQTANADVTSFDEEALYMIEDLTTQVDGITALFTTSIPYLPGKIRVYLDGVLQNFNPTTRVTETSPAAGTFTLASVPFVGQNLVVDYINTTSVFTMSGLVMSQLLKGPVDLTSQVDGLATTFQVPGGDQYYSGTLSVYLDGALQNYTGWISSFSPLTGEFTVTAAPLVGQFLVVYYIKSN